MLNRRKKVAASAATGGGLAGLLLLVLLFPGLIPGGEAQAAPVAPAEECKVVYLALDPADSTLPNPAKESRGAIGTPVTATDPQGQLAEIRERRECGEDAEYDSVLLSSHYADWSIAGLTTRSIAIADIDAFAAEIEANDDLREQVVEELNSLEAASVATNEAVPTGTATIYTVPDGAGGVTTKSGYTVEDGVNLVLTHSSGAVIRYRLDCGAQINWPGGDLPPGLPPCEGDECYPPPPPPPPPNDDKIPSEDPYPQGNAPVGGGPNADPGPGVYIPPAEMEQPPATPRVDPPAPSPTPPAPVPAEPGAPTPAPVPTPDPAPAPVQETGAPVPPPTAPEQQCIPIPGITDC